MFVPPLHVAPLNGDAFDLPAQVIHNLVSSTRAIVNRGWYVAPTQQTVVFKPAQESARRHTAGVSKLSKPSYRRQYDATSIMVHNHTTLTVGRAWHQRGYRVAVVNPTPLRLCHPSLVSSIASQNILLRSGGLAECLIDSGCYTVGSTSEPIVSPQLPIFRTHDGDLLNQPWGCDVITLASDAIDSVTSPMHHDFVSDWLHAVVLAVRRIGANVLVFSVGSDVDAPLVVRLLYNAFMQVKLHALAAINIVVSDQSYNQRVWTPFQQRFNGVMIGNS
ncbi:MAG: hypothetical protein ACO3F2_00155 [Roseiflexaceae bacterium]